jgi:hypothetical protein
MPRIIGSDSGSRLGALQMKVSRSSPGVTKIVSPASRAPAPPAPSAQCTTALPGKWPPHWTRVTPGRTSSRPDQVRMAGSGSVTQLASASLTRMPAPNARAQVAMAP